MIQKTTDVYANIDVTKKADIGNVKAYFYTEDKGISQIRIYIMNNGRAVNFENEEFSPSLNLFLQDGSVFMDEKVEIDTKEKGLVIYQINNEVIKHAGNVNAKLFLKNEEKSIHVANFSFNILSSGIEESVQKELKVTLVEDAVRKIIEEDIGELVDEDLVAEIKNSVGEDVKKYTMDNPQLFKGDKGDKGLQGVKGDKGDTGPQGPMGNISGTDNWQKSKLTKDDGRLQQLNTFNFNSPEEILGDVSQFVYVSGSTNAPTSQSNGTVAYYVITTDYKRIEFRPNATNDVWVKAKNAGTWSGWSKLVNDTDTVKYQKYKLTIDDGSFANIAGVNFNEPEKTLGNGGFFYVMQTTNHPTGEQNYGNVIYQKRANVTTSHEKIYFTPYNSNKQYIRTKVNGVWNNWEEILTTSSIATIQATLTSQSLVIAQLQQQINELKGV